MDMVSQQLSHLNISSNSARIIMSSFSPKYVFKSYSLHSVLNSIPHNAQELDYPFKATDAFVCIVGSCNGLVCLVIKRDVFIWNPFTSVSKKLPGFDQVATSGGVYGFGFDERSDDYKVVGIFGSKTARVYSFKADSWKTIPDFPFKEVLRYDAKFMNGSFHWAVRMNVHPYRYTIVCLDSLHETYGEIEKPDYGIIDYYFELGVLLGCLCVLAVFDHDRSDLWIMKEYGVIDSWTKLCAIPYVNKPGYSLYSMPLAISGSGELLIMANSVVLYNPSDGTFREAMVPKDAVVYTHSAIYVESLVSPNLNGL